MKELLFILMLISGALYIIQVYKTYKHNQKWCKNCGAKKIPQGWYDTMVCSKSCYMRDYIRLMKRRNKKTD